MKRRILCISTIVLCVLTTLSVVAQEKLTGSEQKKYKTALSYARGTNNEMAIKLLTDLYMSHPDDINIVYNLGLCYMNSSGNPDSALYYLKKVDALDTDGWSDSRAELYIAIGRTYQLAYKFDEALKMYDVIEKNDTEKAWADMVQRERTTCRNALELMQVPVKLEIKTVGGEVNSRFNDYRPVLSVDNEMLIFTSRRGSGRSSDFEDGQFEEQIYMSTYKDGEWGKPRLLDDLFEESGLQEAATSLSNNGTELYLVRNGDLYVSILDTVNNEWSSADKLPSGINTQYEENYVCVIEDGQEMFFSSNRPGGQGGYDIYHCYRLPNGEWAKPTNMGDAVNTEYDEDCPIMHPTKRILYFSSNGHNTMGGFDIFFVPENPADSSYTAVMNIGYPINTPDDDLYFVPTAQKDMAYYASIKWNDKQSSGFDIYEVEYDEPEVDKMAVICSNILADDISAVRVRVEQSGESIGRFVPHRQTGRFVAIVEAGGEYVVTASDGVNDIERKVVTTVCNSYNKSGELVTIDPFDFRSVEPVVGQQVASAEKLPAVKEEVSESDKVITGTDVASQIEDGKTYYTVQFMSLRKQCPMGKVYKLDRDKVIEFVYRDGWYVYSYGYFESLSEANNVKREIIKTTYYDDSFVRNVKNYKKFLK
jgi:tetratricopeptide (TPR) repeat protein